MAFDPTKLAEFASTWAANSARDTVDDVRSSAGSLINNADQIAEAAQSIFGIEADNGFLKILKDLAKGFQSIIESLLGSATETLETIAPAAAAAAPAAATAATAVAGPVAGATVNALGAVAAAAAPAASAGVTDTTDAAAAPAAPPARVPAPKPVLTAGA